MSKHGVGGAARRIASGGVGSSPAVSIIRETRKRVLRRMLSDRDRRLCEFDRKTCKETMRRYYPDLARLDAERREIRRKLKEYV